MEGWAMQVCMAQQQTRPIFPKKIKNPVGNLLN